MRIGSSRKTRLPLVGCWLLIAAAIAACSTEPSDQDTACAALDSSWSLEVMPAADPSECAAPPAPRDLRAAAKLSVAVYHFNVQYVAGGLQGFPDGNVSEGYNLDEAAVEDRIIRQGLEPVLDLYLARPTFHADIELQAYAVELIAQRHPDVLDKMRTLAQRGQIDFVSFHYSDQLYVAYPAIDLERSLDLVDQVFARACLPRAKSIFTQEGQFARGQLPIAARRGYTVSILPKNLFTYQRGEAAASANVLYADPSVPGHYVLLGGRGWQKPDAPGGAFELAWTFMDDGEIAFTKDRLNPYFGLDYVLDPARIAEHVAGLEAMEANGFVQATVREAVEAMIARGIAPAPLPEVFDGTWQPRDTLNVYRWMGGSGLFRPNERDSEVLASVWRARTWVEQAERTTNASGASDARLRRGVTAAWREVLLAEVSDSTGWNPFKTEVDYAFAHAASAEGLARNVLRCAGVSAEAEPSPVIASCEGGAPVELSSVGVEITAPRRQFTARARRCSGSSSTVEVLLEIPKLADQEPYIEQEPAHELDRELEIRVRRSGADFELIPALEATSRTYAASELTFDEIGVPLPMGAIGLGGDRWLLQDHATMRLAALLTRTATGSDSIRLRDLTVPRALESRRRFFILESKSSAEAVADAVAVNRPGALAP
ncbi:MAG: hypothetical protein IT384_27555 [Deltaproteobacteria bacterium]|nr:hypothetical protein [Deltaproteobacteria bacterium]